MSWTPNTPAIVELGHIEAEIVSIIHRVQELEGALQNLYKVLPHAEEQEVKPYRRRGSQ